MSSTAAMPRPIAAPPAGPASTPRYGAASIGRYSQPGSPLTAWNTARSAGPTRPSDATTAQPANTARLAASTIRSRWMRLTAPGPPAVPALLPPEARRLPAGPEDLHHPPYSPGTRQQAPEPQVGAGPGGAVAS